MKRCELGSLAWYCIAPFLGAFGVGLFFGAMWTGGMVALFGARVLGCTP